MNKLGILWVLTIIIHLLPQYEANSEIQTVRIRSPGLFARLHNDAKIYAVLQNEPLKIVIENVIAKNIECREVNQQDKSYFFKSNTNNFHIYNDEQSILQIYNVTSNMSTKWECDIIYNKTNTDGTDKILTYYLNMRVKNAKEVNVFIGGIPIIFERTNLSVTDYDGIYEHKCEVGETVDFTCKNIYKEGKLMMQYRDAHGNMVMNTSNKTMLSFRIPMKVENNSSYIDCTYQYSTYINYQEFTYRTKFAVKDKVYNGYPVGLIIGCVAGALVLIAAAVTVYCWWTRK